MLATTIRSQFVTSQLQRRAFSSTIKDINKVCVVGGGVAGLQTVDRLRGLGIDCTLFESQPDVGGVWRSHTAESGLQVPRELYEIPGFHYREEENFVHKFPRGAEVQKYIQRFAKERDIYPMCRFNTSVFSIVPNTKGWYVQYEDNQKGLTHNEKFDYVVICTGMHADPNFTAKNDSMTSVSQSQQLKEGSSNDNFGEVAEIIGYQAVLSSGFTKTYSFLDEATKKALDKNGNGPYLYRQIIPLGVQNLAFIGFVMSPCNTVLTQAMQSLWLEKVLAEDLPLPSKDAMIARLEEEASGKHSWMPVSDAMFQYHDQLCKDMGVPHRMKEEGLNTENISPYSSRDYEEYFKKEELNQPERIRMNPNQVPQI